MKIVWRWARKDEGFALLAVSITVTALALIVATVAGAARHQVNQARNEVARLQLDAAMAGALATVAAALADGSLSSDALLHAQIITVGGIDVRVTVKPEAGKIDLNAAPPEFLASLFRAVGVDERRSAKLAGAVADWRDGDSVVSDNGAEISDYLSAGKDYGPTNQAFESPAELSLILGGDAELAQCLAADVTVFTSMASVDSAYSPPHVRAALGLHDVGGESTDLGGLNVQTGVIFDLTAFAKGSDGISASHETIVRLTGNPRNPVWVLSDTAPAPDAARSDAACKVFAAENAELASR